METISLKIEREDKEIILKYLHLFVLEERKKKQKTLFEAIRSEGILGLYQKFSRSSCNEKAISLNLSELLIFMSFLKTYKDIGDYEMANSLLLIEQIKTKLSKKNITI